MTSIGQRKGILWTVFRVPRRYVVMQEDFSEGIGPSSVLEKTRGMERTLTNHKENGTKMPILWFSTLKKVDTRYSEASARSTEESWRRKEEDLRFTVLRNLQTLSFFYFCTIHWANQLSIYGAVSSWCEDSAGKIVGQTFSHVDKSISRENGQLSKKLTPQEVDSLVRNPTRTEGAAGNSLHDHLRRFKGLDPDDQFRKIWELAG